MAEARQRESRSEMGMLLALLHNVNRDPKKTAAKQPWHFFPSLKLAEAKPIPGSIEDLKLFLPSAPP